jgi:ankyrin repeat protein
LAVLQSLLQDGKVDINDSDLFGETALLKAAKQGRRAVVDALIRYGACRHCLCAALALAHAPTPTPNPE